LDKFVAILQEVGRDQNASGDGNPYVSWTICCRRNKIPDCSYYVEDSLVDSIHHDLKSCYGLVFLFLDDYPLVPTVGYFPKYLCSIAWQFKADAKTI